MPTTDTQSHITYANAAFVQVNGFENEEILGAATQSRPTPRHAGSGVCRHVEHAEDGAAVDCLGQEPPQRRLCFGIERHESSGDGIIGTCELC
ncbi:PAS domain-containing protein [Paraburkholderia sp. SIMBA_030]|uniref:PAS domain-containing protein n=1 Tax=Paraburkholderia sp. SIMBA_030 TaxID=3085773 RepID=UPI00397D6857